jgi:tRNA threonylcarbamoyladenosine biosynthesis protein TsaE
MNPIKTIPLPTVEETEDLAARLAKGLVAPLVITFSGEIGAGKTTFIRAMLRALGIQSAIKSPTFSLVESYRIDPLQIHHFDLYRIHDETELEYVGFRDYFTPHAICCIEWPEQAKNYITHVDVKITLEWEGAGRHMKINACSPAGAAMLSCLAGE